GRRAAGLSPSSLSSRLMRSIEGPRASPRGALSFDAVRPPPPTAVSPNTMSDNRFPAAIDMQGFVDSWLEKATVYWDTAAGCLGLVSSARACRSTSSGTKSRIGLCSNLARALSTAAEICSGARCPYLVVRRRSTSAIISSSLISATGDSLRQRAPTVNPCSAVRHSPSPNARRPRYGLRWEDAEVAEDAGVAQARMLVGLLRDEIAEISDKLKAP